MTRLAILIASIAAVAWAAGTARPVTVKRGSFWRDSLDCEWAFV
jgi:hypothetical protein